MINAKYTVVLKSLLDDPTTKAKIDDALSKYPIYEPKKKYDMIPNRSELNQKVLNHFKYREIGFETPGRFIDELEIAMCEMMPRYNELFKTVEIMSDIKDPFGNIDVLEHYTETRSGTSSSSDESKNNTVITDSSNTTNNNVSDSKNVKTTTPQNQINIAGKDIDSVSYADEIDWNKNTGNDTSKTTGNSETDSTVTTSGSAENRETIEHTFTKTGNQGVNTYAHDMVEFRQTIIDIVEDILNDDRLTSLFMRVY